MWLLRGRSRVVNPLAGGEGGTSRDTGTAEPISGRYQATRPEPAHATKETTMPRALLYYLAQGQTADRYRQAQRDTPGRAASRASHPRPSPRAHRAHAVSAVVARRLRTVLGGSP